MRWNFQNILQGAASVRLFPGPSQYLKIEQALRRRTKQESAPAEQVLQRFMAERLLGQVIFTALCLLSMAVAVIGAKADWPDLPVVLLAVTPCALMLLVSYMSKPDGNE